MSARGCSPDPVPAHALASAPPVSGQAKERPMAPRSDAPLTHAERARLGGLRAAELYPDRHYVRASQQGRQRSVDAWIDDLDPDGEIGEETRANLVQRYRSVYYAAMVSLRHSRNRAKREAEAETV